MPLSDSDFRGLDTQTKKGRAILALKDCVDTLVGGGSQIGEGVGLFAPAGNMVNLTDNTSTALNWRGNLAGVDPTVEYDDLGFYSNLAPTVFTIPVVVPAITRVIAWCGGTWGQGLAGERQLTVRKNLSQNFAGSVADSLIVVAATSQPMYIHSGVFSVVAGDTIDFQLGVFNDGANGSDFTTPRGGLLVVR
jgi:hypothetical protein